ncbi:digestive cysteine proteinase 1-like [Ptychodera flava]|uniref:digestive cysteine proteinase 1-like n=1 Tax=Ptychodera flava TaxID=63121 RepID=UPI00396A333B
MFGMDSIVCFIALLVSGVGAVAGPVRAPPVFSKAYHARGILRLPYAELEEPFEIFYNGSLGNSRIDFYGGLDKTYLLGSKGPYGATYIISPMTDKTKTTSDACFFTNGTTEAPVVPQTALPDLAKFVSIGKSIVRGITVDTWQYVSKEGGKTSTYTMYILPGENPKPIQYEMMGYDSLLGSHYDKYFVDYMYYDTAPIDRSVFEVSDKSRCGDFPGPGLEHHVTANPFQEIIEPAKVNRIHKLFDEFKDKHGRKYQDEREHSERMVHFTNNVRYIHSNNRAGKSYKLKINHLADRTPEELKMMRGFRYSPGPRGGLPFEQLNLRTDDLPDSIDWNIRGAVTQVKDQAVCGSCWSFGSTGAIEGALFMKTGKLVRLSQQNLVDCSWGYGNNGCYGGEQFRSFQWVIANGGIASEEEYGPYMGQNGLCHFNSSKIATKISNYTSIPTGDLDALKVAVANQGPVTVSIDASPRSFSFYANGVYYDAKCGNTTDDLDHSVLAVGYGTLDNKDYWLIKNSWSTYWGNNGYILISKKDNNCGVATDASFVII